MPLQAKAGGRRATSGTDAIKVINFYFSKSIKGVQGARIEGPVEITGDNKEYRG